MLSSKYTPIHKCHDMQENNIGIHDAQNLLECVVSSSKKFLENDINVQILDVCRYEEIAQNQYSALVKFESSANFYCRIYIDKPLLGCILQVMVPFLLSDEEKEELYESLTQEVVNTVAGLAIASFPLKYENALMSQPLMLDEKTVTTVTTDTFFVSKMIRTDCGNFTCSIIATKE